MPGLAMAFGMASAGDMWKVLVPVEIHTEPVSNSNYLSWLPTDYHQLKEIVHNNAWQLAVGAMIWSFKAWVGSRETETALFWGIFKK
jgi:hypothetical protein